MKINQLMSKTGVTSLVSVIIAGLISGGGVYAYQRSQQAKATQDLQSQISILKSQLSGANLPTSTPVPTPLATATPIPSTVIGTLKLLSTDLYLIDTKSLTDISGGNAVATYYGAGAYSSGAYAGYSRIFAVGPAMGPGGPSYYQFATKDNSAYILDGDTAKATSVAKTAEDSPYYGLNTKKVTSIQRLPSDFPSNIPLSSSYGLSRNDNYQGDGTLLPFADNTGEHLVTDFSSYSKLSTPGLKITLYAAPASPSTDPSDPYNTYVATTSKVIAVDSTGLAVTYGYVNEVAAQSYSAKLAAYKDAVVAYNMTDKKGAYPEAPVLANLSIKATDITTTGTVSLYTSYDKALPRACARDDSTIVVKNIADTDLVTIGKYQGSAIYSLKDPSSPLIKLAYDGKVASLADPTFFKQVNPTFAVKPTLAQYAAKHPLLFVKDYWGRLLGLGEYDYNIIGGCGKPVVYLYPPTPTAVSLNFLSPMKLTTSIPTYHNGWEVLAQPNGTLTDLQPKYTDCLTIDTAKKGSEYAANACATHSYPYLYWAGTSIQQPYPAITSGWVVSASDLPALLNQKLDRVGLTEKEKTDMLSYWLPELQNTKAPYYRISFLQTADMNRIVPMNITPKPNSLLRIFLDWTPLQEKPSQALAPEMLQTFNRTGFAVVEWGGLKRTAE